MEPLKESGWQKAVRHTRWGRTLQLAANAIVIAGVAFALLSLAVVIFFGLIYGW